MHDLVRGRWEQLRPNGDFEGCWRAGAPRRRRARHGGAAAHRADTRRLGSPVRRRRRSSATASRWCSVPIPTSSTASSRTTAGCTSCRGRSPSSRGTTSAQVAPATAERLGVASGDVVELGFHGRTVRAPVWISPGHARDSVTVALGYGRTHLGRVGDDVGFDAGAIRPSDALDGGSGLTLVKTGTRMLARQHAGSSDHGGSPARPARDPGRVPRAPGVRGGDGRGAPQVDVALPGASPTPGTRGA